MFYTKIEDEELRMIRDEFVNTLPYELNLINSKDNDKKTLFSYDLSKQVEKLKIDQPKNNLYPRLPIRKPHAHPNQTLNIIFN